MSSTKLPGVVFDVNILISAVVFRGPPHLCVRAAERGLVQSITCEAILTDCHDKLLRKFEFDQAYADGAVDLIRRMSTCIVMRGVVQGVCRDRDDDLVLDCAVAGEADLVVTGDKDLLVLDPFADPTRGGRRIRVLRAAEFVGNMSGHGTVP